MDGPPGVDLGAGPSSRHFRIRRSRPGVSRSGCARKNLNRTQKPGGCYSDFCAQPATSRHSRESDSGSANLRIGVGERSEPLPLLRVLLPVALTFTRVLAVGGPAGTKFGGNGELSACFRARLGFRGETLNRTCGRLVV